MVKVGDAKQRVRRDVKQVGYKGEGILSVNTPKKAGRFDKFGKLIKKAEIRKKEKPFLELMW